MLETLINKTKYGLAGLIIITSLYSGCASAQNATVRIPVYESMKGCISYECQIEKANKNYTKTQQIQDEAKAEYVKDNIYGTTVPLLEIRF